jgi:hypothetical protein
MLVGLVKNEKKSAGRIGQKSVIIFKEPKDEM